MKTLIKKCIKCGDINSHWENAIIHDEDNCNGELVEMPISEDEFATICYISSENEFIQAMIDLKDKDIIEYNLKMSQFRSQLEQQKSSKVQNDTIPRCPHCKSTNIKSISALNRGASIAMLGVFSKKINKNFECLNCKYAW